MAELSNQNTSDFSSDQLLPAFPERTRHKATHTISDILNKYQGTKDILSSIHDVTSYSDSQLLSLIYDKLLQRSPTASEADDQRIDSIRNHIICQLTEVYSRSQQSLVTLLSHLHVDALSFTSEERKNTQLQSTLLDLFSNLKQANLDNNFQPLMQQLDRLQEAYARHTFYHKTVNTSVDTHPFEEMNYQREISEFYWARRVGITQSDFSQLLRNTPSLISLCESMGAHKLPIELLPARLAWLAQAENPDSNDNWFGVLAEYYRGLLPLERFSNLLDPLHNKASFSNSAGITSQIEQLHSRRKEPNWIAALCCRILCDEGIKLLKRQRHLAHLAPEISRLVAEDYYRVFLATGTEHGEALEHIIPVNTQREFDSAVGILRTQQLLKREYRSSHTATKISHFFSAGGKEHLMWKGFLNLLIALERGVDSFESALGESKVLPDKALTRPVHPEQAKKIMRGLLQDSITTLRTLTYLDGETGKHSEYQSQLGVLKQSLGKVPLDAIEESQRGLFDLCKSYFLLPFSSAETPEVRGDPTVLAQLIAIMRRSCMQ